MSSSHEPQSWGDSIRQYEQSKKTRPFAKEEIVPARRIGLCERKAMEREVDPILMQYRNPEKEQKFLEQTLAQTAAHQAKPRRMAGTLNLFSGEVLEPKHFDLSKKKKPPREWNLISHFPSDVHCRVGIAVPFEETQKLRERATHDISQRKRKGSREFNILSNRYYVNDDGRQREDYERLKADVLEKYWKTHDFDPIVGQYIDGEKEAKFREQREVIGKVQGASQFQKLPPSLVYSAGNSYNLISHEVTDELKLQVTSTVADRSLNRQRGNEVVANLNATSAHQDALDRERRINRVSFNRWRRELDRGYDPIFRNDLTADQVQTIVCAPNNRLRTQGRRESTDIGTPGRKLEPPLVARPISAWDRLQKDDVNNVTALFNATGSSEILHQLTDAWKKKGGSDGNRGTAMHVRTGTAALSSRPRANDVALNPLTGGQTGSAREHPPQTAAPRDLTKSSIGIQQLKQGAMNRSASQPNVNSSRIGSERSNNYAPLAVSLSKNASTPNLASAGDVPQLDLSRAEPHPFVTYQADLSGPPGQPVPIVRTGGGGFMD